MLRDFLTLHSISLGMPSLAVFQACLASCLAKRCCSICSGLLVRLLFLFNLLARLKKNIYHSWSHVAIFQELQTSPKRHKKILLFTYMRGGSTFLGSIFQNHPEAFYWYESLAPFYYQFLLEQLPATSNVWFDPQYIPR